MSTSQTVKRNLSVHRTILDEIDADRRAAYLSWTLRRALRADTARAAARHRRNRPHWSSTATAPAATRIDDFCEGVIFVTATSTGRYNSAFAPAFEREQTATQATNRPPRPPCGLPGHHDTASGPSPSRPATPRGPGAKIFPIASLFGQRPRSVHNEDPPSPRGPSSPLPLPPRGTAPRIRRARANRAALTCVRYHEETLSSSPRKTTRRPARDVGRASCVWDLGTCPTRSIGN